MKEEDEFYYPTNKAVVRIYAAAIMIAIIGIINSIRIGILEDSGIILVIGSVSSILIALLFYAFGALIDVVNDVKTNTEHIRDYFESDSDDE